MSDADLIISGAGPAVMVPAITDCMRRVARVGAARTAPRRRADLPQCRQWRSATLAGQGPGRRLGSAHRVDHPHIRSKYFATVGRIEAGARAIRPFLDAAPTPLPEILPESKCCWQRPDRRVAAFFASGDLAGRYQGSCGHEHGLGSLDASGIASRRCLR